MRAIVGTMIMPGVLDRFLATKGYEGQLTREPTLSGETDNLVSSVSGQAFSAWPLR